MKFVISTFLALSLCSASAQAQLHYTITDLGGRNGVDYRDGPMALNEQGQVAGEFEGHAFLWSNGTMTDLGTLPPEGPEDDTVGVAYGINDHGVAVGSSGSFGPIFMSGLQFARGIITRKNRLYQFTRNDSSFIPYAINDAGQIAGLNQYRGFFYANGSLIPLGTLSHVPNGNLSTARSLNQQGQVVGWSTVGSQPERQLGPLATHALLWQRHGKSGQMRDLGTLPGWVNSYAYGINRRGEIVGSDSDATGGPHGLDLDKTDTDGRAVAFLWRKGKVAGLGTLPGSKSSAAFGINDSTAIVGTSDDQAFLWQQGRMLDLNACLPSGSGWALEEARAINNKGQIIGSGKRNGQEHMFLLTPQIGAALTGVTAAQASETQTAAIRVHVRSVLDQIDTFNYLRGAIAAASGYELVEQVCLDKPEVQYLLTHSAEAVPAMLERLDSPTGIHCYSTRIVYFTVFRHAQDPRVLPALARYLDAVPDEENVGAPGSLFHYAVAAIRTLAPSTLPADSPGTFPASPDLRVVLRTRHQIAAKVRSLAAAPKQNKQVKKGDYAAGAGGV